MIATTFKPSNNNTCHQDEIITINAGGKVFQALRSTLCLPMGDIAFTKLFEKDSNVFLDHDPELIEIILNFLRMKKIEDRFDPIVEPPSVPESKTKDFRRLLNHFGLTAFFYYPSTTTTHSKNMNNNSTLTTAAHLIREVRRMSFDSHDLETSSTNNNKPASSSDSVSTTADACITEGFDYCYG